MSPEGPVYSGPTNIYLAYPVQVEISRWWWWWSTRNYCNQQIWTRISLQQGPDGRGYITQPFSGPSYSPGRFASPMISWWWTSEVDDGHALLRKLFHNIEPSRTFLNSTLWWYFQLDDLQRFVRFNKLLLKHSPHTELWWADHHPPLHHHHHHHHHHQ